MVYFEKSQPAPASLAVEKAKAKGSYREQDVLDRLKDDFKNKCYICEYKEPTSIHVEHFTPHKGNKNLMFEWNNLFLSCSHCNSTKHTKYDNILNCTDPSHDVENNLKYIFKPFPFEQVQIEALDGSPKTNNTKELLLAVYNGTTPEKLLESSNLRNKLLDDIMDFQEQLCEYFKSNGKQPYAMKIEEHLSKTSNFTAFKRWIIKDNPRLKTEFEKFFD